jgi:hypothetical protein
MLSNILVVTLCDPYYSVSYIATKGTDLDILTHPKASLDALKRP